MSFFTVYGIISPNIVRQANGEGTYDMYKKLYEGMKNIQFINSQYDLRDNDSDSGYLEEYEDDMNEATQKLIYGLKLNFPKTDEQWETLLDILASSDKEFTAELDEDGDLAVFVDENVLFYFCASYMEEFDSRVFPVDIVHAILRYAIELLIEACDCNGFDCAAVESLRTKDMMDFLEDLLLDAIKDYDNHPIEMYYFYSNGEICDIEEKNARGNIFYFNRHPYVLYADINGDPVFEALGRTGLKYECELAVDYDVPEKELRWVNQHFDHIMHVAEKDIKEEIIRKLDEEVGLVKVVESDNKTLVVYLGDLEIAKITTEDILSNFKHEIWENEDGGSSVFIGDFYGFCLSLFKNSQALNSIVDELNLPEIYGMNNWILNHVLDRSMPEITNVYDIIPEIEVLQIVDEITKDIQELIDEAADADDDEDFDFDWDEAYAEDDEENGDDEETANGFTIDPSFIELMESGFRKTETAKKAFAEKRTPELNLCVINGSGYFFDMDEYGMVDSFKGADFVFDGKEYWGTNIPDEECHWVLSYSNTIEMLLTRKVLEIVKNKN